MIDSPQSQLYSCRKQLWRVGLPVVLAFLMGLTGCTTPESQRRAGKTPGVVKATGVVNLQGEFVDPFRVSNEKAIVFFFVRTDCPVSNRYAPEIQRLFARYSPRGVTFWLVYPDADTTPEEISTHSREYRLSLNALRDPHHLLVARSGAKVTPESAVFLANGKRIYHGRIDNRYVDFGKERPNATEHDLDEVLNAVVTGKPILTKSAPAVGCFIAESS